LVDDSPTGDLTYTHPATRRRDQTVTSDVTRQFGFEDTA
jgi:hypothetical protein